MAKKGIILFIAAHPDDEVLGAGGVMAKAKAEGHRVCVTILGEGVTSRFDSRHEASSGLKAKLREDVQRVRRFMEWDDLVELKLPDNRFDTVPLLDITRSLEKEIKRIEPDIIYTHYRGDLNIDHRITFDAVVTACRPGCFPSVKEIYSFYIPSSTDWNPDGVATFKPNTFVNIRKYISKKMKAMDMYRSERRTYPHPRSKQAIKIASQYWGLTSGMEYAEPFILIRKNIL